MIKNKTIAVFVKGNQGSQTQIDAENLQYNLLGRGFRWVSGGGVSTAFIGLQGWPEWTLYIDTSSKLMQWSPEIDVEKMNTIAYHFINLWSKGFQAAVETIVNPPKPPAEYDTIQGLPDYNQKVRVYRDTGVVEFWENGDHQLTTNKDVIEGVAKSLGLPTTTDKEVVVQFEYPSSVNWNSVIRRVKLISLDSVCLTGIEITRGTEKTGTFKKYRVARINSPICLYTYE